MKTSSWKKLISLFFLAVLSGCSPQQTDEQRIIKEVDATSVHLITGLKLIVTNPYDDPDISAVKSNLNAILENQKSRPSSEGLSFLELSRLAKVAYQAKEIGATEVAKGKSSEFLFLTSLALQNKLPKYSNLTEEQHQELSKMVKQDHALTLAGLYGFKLHPVLPVPITQKTLLYEAWMADDVEFKETYFNIILRGLQASTFARNDYCDFAQDNAEYLRNTPIAPINIDRIKSGLSSMLGLGRVAAHAPEAAAILIPIALLPAALELLPNVVRVMAHLQTASCFDKRDNPSKMLRQQEFALDALGNTGIPDSELALFRAGLAYKSGDLATAKEHLLDVENSKMLDERSKSDILLLAKNLDTPDPSLVERYFSSTYLTMTIGKILNQRISDAGFYDNLGNSKAFVGIQKVLSNLMALNADDALNILNKGKDKGVDLFNSFSNKVDL